MKWFKHDSDASTDAKLKKLVIRYGTDGYAIYFHCLELITGNISENKITFELEHDSEIIADNLKVKGDASISAIDKVNHIMEYIIELGLFENSLGKITCMKLFKRLDQSMTSNLKFRKMINNVKNNNKIMISHDNVMKEEIRIDKIRIDKKIKTVPDGTDLYPELKIIYNNFLLSHGLTQPDINQAIWSIEKERQSISNLFKRFKSIDVFKQFMESANNNKWIRENSFIPSTLLSQYSSLILKNKTENKMDYSVGSF